MKVLFFDYDGVINKLNTPVRQIGNILVHSDPEMVYRLNLIVDRTGAEIVLSSSWRHLPDWREALKESGIIKPLFDRTPLTGKTRGASIQQWLDAHSDVEKYAIIDDDADMLPSQLPSFFQTDTRYGLTQEIADAIQAYLLSNL